MNGRRCLMELPSDEIEILLQCWRAIMPDALDRWWARVRSVQSNRARYAAEWLKLDSRWAAYDRARGQVTSADEDERVRTFIREYQPNRDDLARALLREGGGVGPVSLLIDAEKLAAGLAEVYRAAVRRHLLLSGISERATELGAEAYTGALWGHFRAATDRQQREVAGRIGPEPMCRRWSQLTDQPILVITLLRLHFDFSLADATAVYRRVRPPRENTSAS